MESVSSRLGQMLRGLEQAKRKLRNAKELVQEESIKSSVFSQGVEANNYQGISSSLHIFPLYFLATFSVGDPSHHATIPI